MRSRTQLTDTELESLFESLGTNIPAELIVFTSDTLGDFRVARRSYVERGTVEIDNPLTFIVRNLQIRRGGPHLDLTVADLGDVRACVILAVR
jgi:hypothetical protein